MKKCISVAWAACCAAWLMGHGLAIAQDADEAARSYVPYIFAGDDDGPGRWAGYIRLTGTLGGIGNDGEALVIRAEGPTGKKVARSYQLHFDDFMELGPGTPGVEEYIKQNWGRTYYGVVFQLEFVGGPGVSRPTHVFVSDQPGDYGDFYVAFYFDDTRTWVHGFAARRGLESGYSETQEGDPEREFVK